MTEERDKAKNVINELELYAEDLQYHSADEMKEALDMTIRAFEQQPCEDAISKQQCIDAVNKILAQYVPKIYLYTLPLELEKTITDLPSVNTKKTGHWEEVQFRTIPYNRISKAKKCSVCGKRKDKYVTWNYCPNCGSYNGG